jgi:hypothetical protein
MRTLAKLIAVRAITIVVLGGSMAAEDITSPSGFSSLGAAGRPRLAQSVLE